MRIFQIIPATLFLFAAAWAMPAASGADAGAGDDSSSGGTPMVVELFTSQGCSSCPPADSFLQELSRRDDVLALSLHVDYWDYIGWRDTFASSQSTARQRSYARTMGQRSVYTPQMVIDGKFQEVGSRRSKVMKFLEYRAENPGHGQVKVTVALSPSGDLTVKIAPDEKGKGATKNATKNATVWLMEFDSRHETKVRSGENAGRTLVYVNVVRNIRSIGTWKGEAKTITVSAAELDASGERDGCAVILQTERTGPVIGAAWVKLRN